ncbi:hypothetical protein [Bacteroides caecimuris]|uniref:winged helix-turn-helix domain-containing protein n=2 Tax=Bacteroides caecimuris TaxID=1796613 RepID=UPI00264797B5|nr:hypothetical protein [Bacteroides caecimuris]
MRTICSNLLFVRIMDPDRRMALLFFILMIILVVTLERMLYASGEVALANKTRITLLETIEDGFNAQYDALGLYESGVKIEPDRKFEHCTVISAENKKVKNIIIDKDKTIVSSGIDTRISHTVLAKEGIDADACLSLWSKKLSAANIVSCHALQIHIHADSAYVLACGDSTLFLAEYKKIGSVYAGLSNEIEVEPFIRYSWLTVLKNASIKMVVIGELIFLVLLFICFIYYLRKKIKKSVSSVEDISQSVINLANLRYVYSSHEFYVDNRKVQVRSQSASLLLLFLKAPSHTVTKEEIISCLWRPEDSGVEGRLRRAVSDLRSLFREESVNISIKLSGNNYSLIV